MALIAERPAAGSRASLSLLAFVLVVATAAAYYVFRKGIPPADVGGAYAVFLFLLVPFLGFGFPEFAAALRSLAARGPGGIAAVVGIIAGPPAALLVLNLGSEGIVPAVSLLAYAYAPALLLALAASRGDPPTIFDVTAVIAAWVPAEIGALRGLWAVGATDPSYVIAKTLSVSLLLAGFIAIRPLSGIGYRWRFRLEDFGVASVALVAFLLLAVPAALATGFVVFEPSRISIGGILYRFLAIGLLIALPEEILFRGVIFNLMQKAWTGRRGPWPALIVSSVVFGLSHVNNFPYVDWRYVVIATWAGLWYGWCYLRTGNLLAGILTHTSVDVLHRIVFTTPR